MANDSSDYMKDILATPLGDLISSIGNGVADAQTALDEASLAKTLEMYNSGDDKMIELMRQIGYQPAFYAIPEAEVEANVSLSMAVDSSSSSSSSGAGGIANKRASRTKIYTTPTNATNSNRYNIQTNASAKLKFKIVPVPPSNAMSAMRVAPNLVGKTEDELTLILADFGLLYEIGTDSDSGKVITQSPEAGEILKEGDTVTINL